MRAVLAGVLLAAGLAAAAHAAPVRIVAAENVYGDIAAQIAGNDATVSSILVNPQQDPHEFEASTATARALAEANLVIYNGIGYDPWLDRLLSASRAPARLTIVVADLLHKKSGDNPHVWYDPAAPQALAQAVAAALARLDPARKADYAARRAAFEQSLKPLSDTIARLRGKYAGTPVTATEPVFGYMAQAIGLIMRNPRFQLAIMNGTEPGAAEIAAFERDLRTRAVKALIYNSQTAEKLSERMRALATEAGVPVVAVTETEPPGEAYQQWVAAELDALDHALGGH
jgi:zinc/manganese transport system substrate-binding protein